MVSDFSLFKNNPELTDFVENCLPGFHVNCLEKPYKLVYLSKSFCSLLGYPAEELLTHNVDSNHPLIFSEDWEKFLNSMDMLAEKEQPITLQYKIRRKDGTTFLACNSSISRRLPDGKMYAFSVITDVSYMPDFDIFGDMLSSVLPFGYIQCTCERYPNITYMNTKMKEYLHLDETSPEWEQSAMDNLFFMMPIDEHEKLRANMERVRHTPNHPPIQIEHDMFTGNGQEIHLVGWLSVVPGDFGRDEYAIIYRKVDTVNELESLKENSYFSVLKRSYTAIFSLNLEDSIVECLWGPASTPLGSFSSLKMTIDSVTTFLLNNYIYSEDRSSILHFIERITNPHDTWDDKSVIQIDFRLKHQESTTRYLAVAIHLSEKHVLLCCRNLNQTALESPQLLEGRTLRELCDWLDCWAESKENLVGLFMIEETPDYSVLLYGTASVMHFLGLDTEEGERRSTPPSLDECIKAANISRSDFYAMTSGQPLYLWSRSAAIAYQFLLSCRTITNGDKKLYIIRCIKDAADQPPSNVEPDVDLNTLTLAQIDAFLEGEGHTSASSASGADDVSDVDDVFPDLYNVLSIHTSDCNELDENGRVARTRIYARTFGHFDLFLDKKPVIFSSGKEKELMALLIDRNGGTLSSGLAISYLWPDEPNDDRTSARYRKLAMGLKKTLTSYGIAHIIINHKGIRSINKTALICDYYEMLAGNETYRKMFHNMYMTDYSWSEDTLATLWDYTDAP
jgi:PAS domain S-box-containing protein